MLHDLGSIMQAIKPGKVRLTRGVESGFRVSKLGVQRKTIQVARAKLGFVRACCTHRSGRNASSLLGVEAPADLGETKPRVRADSSSTGNVRRCFGTPGDRNGSFLVHRLPRRSLGETCQSKGCAAS